MRIYLKLESYSFWVGYTVGSLSVIAIVFLVNNFILN
jgi:hypothetical protein